MSALSKILIKSVGNITRNLVKFEVGLEDLIDKFKEGCPTKEELLKIVQQKNQMQTALENVVGAFSKVESTASTTESVVSAVSSAIQVIKLIPVPSAVPPGIGVPLNVITVLADSLDTLGKVLQASKGALSVVPSAAKTINSSANLVLAKLQELDAALNVCIEEMAEGMNQEEKNALINEIGNVAATAGNFSNIQLNIEDENILLSRLSTNSPNPYFYQRSDSPTSDWRLFIEYDSTNEFSFPSRRILAKNLNFDPKNIFAGVALYNIEGGRYSYSTSVKVLINEVQFRIETLDKGYFYKKWLESSLGVENLSLRPGSDEPFVPPNNRGGENTTSTPPKAISLSTEGGQLSMNLPIQEPLTAPSNTKTITVTTTVPNASLTIVVDSGKDTNPLGSGQFNTNDPDETTDYAEGKVKVRVDTALGTTLNDVKYILADREAYSKTFYYPEPGVYTFRYRIEEQEDITSTQNARVFFSSPL